MAKVLVIMKKGIINASSIKWLACRMLPIFPDGDVFFAVSVEALSSNFDAGVDIYLVDFLFLDFFLDIECPPFQFSVACMSLDTMLYFKKISKTFQKKDRVRGLCLFKLSPLTAPAFSCKIQTKQMFIYLPHGEKTPTDKVGRGCLRECLGCRHS